MRPCLGSKGTGRPYASACRLHPGYRHGGPQQPGPRHHRRATARRHARRPPAGGAHPPYHPRPLCRLGQGEDHPLDRPPVYRRALCGPYPRPVRHRADGHQPPRARLHHLCRGRSRPGPLHLCGQDFLCRLLPRSPAHSLYEREGGLLWSLTLFPVVGERQRAQGLAPGDTRPVHPFHGSSAPPHRLYEHPCRQLRYAPPPS